MARSTSFGLRPVSTRTTSAWQFFEQPILARKRPPVRCRRSTIKARSAQRYSKRREDLEAARRAGEMPHINVLGLVTIAQDVTPDLARATIASISALGALHATPAVKAALADRTR